MKRQRNRQGSIFSRPLSDVDECTDEVSVSLVDDNFEKLGICFHALRLLAACGDLDHREGRRRGKSFGFPAKYLLFRSRACAIHDGGYHHLGYDKSIHRTI
eukprot:scaffold149441_cov35-Attheya_sp.AAC.3